MRKSIVWTIAGSDSGGGAGMQADLHTFQSLNTHGCSVITAITAQNSTSVNDIHYIPSKTLSSQIETLHEDLPAKAIKLGMLGDEKNLEIIANYIASYPGKVVCDPVMKTTSGSLLSVSNADKIMKEKIFPHATIITPNCFEAEALIQKPINSFKEIESAAKELLSFGSQSVLIKGGHVEDQTIAPDYWTNGKTSFWIQTKRYSHSNTHGSGCTLSAAIAALLAQDYEIKEAITVAKMYIAQGIRIAKKFGDGPGPVAHAGWPNNANDLPKIVSYPDQYKDQHFPSCGEEPIGIYPVVHAAKWLEVLLPYGISTVQLRIKECDPATLEKEVIQAVAIAKRYNARLFINDYWELAIKHDAYGVHLGQDDLLTADIGAIHQAGLKLGLSSHCYYELALAYAINPSYIALGPIYPTTSKQMRFPPQGLPRLNQWSRLLNCPLVAIGGIDMDRLIDVFACGADGAAMISAITEAKNLEEIIQRMLALQGQSRLCE